MKYSAFNVIAHEGGDLLIYNSLSGALLTFEGTSIETMENSIKENVHRVIPREFLPALIEGGFLIDDDRDEYDQIRKLTQRRIGWEESWHFSIMLNLACNFKCFYCFQRRQELFMPDLIVGRVLKMIDLVAKRTGKISVDWYGGEPTLSFGLLKRMNDQMAEICQKTNTEFVVSMTTNGYALSDDILDYLSSFKMSHLQITLDVPRDYHDKTRILKNNGPTFDVILENIKSAVAHGIHVLVRVNATTVNLDESFVIFEELERAGLKNKVEVSIRPVISSEANPCEQNCLDPICFGEAMASHYYEAAKKGWVVLPFVDNLQSMSYCIANYPTHAIVDPSGNVFKCGEVFDERENVGEIDENGHLLWKKEQYDAFVMNDPLEFPECRNCAILPICMGGCHMLRFWKGKVACNEFKHNLDLFVKILYYNQANLDSVHSM